MQPHLVFTLAATLAAMGELAGHERRGSLTWPGRSAILGLLGAALGLRRDGDFSALDALSVAVAVFDEGAPMRDYHTVESVPSAAVRQPNSRPEALAAAGLRSGTTITLRDYRAGSLYGVAVWGGDLPSLRDALSAPRFTLYLGRKSCPLSAPPAPSIVDAAGPEEALAALVLPPWRHGATADRLMTDPAAGDAHVDYRQDQPLDRTSWHFASRPVAIPPGVDPARRAGGMTLYLSRLRLSRQPSARALDAILNPDEPGPRLDAHHRLLWAAFADTPDRRRDFLWREERAGEFLTLSARPPTPADLFETPDVKAFAPELAPDDRLAFALRANATRDRKDAGRVDVVMDALHAVPKGARAPERMALAQREGAAWLARQGEAAGFRLIGVEVGDYSVAALPGYRGNRAGQPQFGILDITGMLEVTDPAAFLARLAQGFGRAKAFGCGLMLIRRAG